LISGDWDHEGGNTIQVFDERGKVLYTRHDFVAVSRIAWGRDGSVAIDVPSDYCGQVCVWWAGPAPPTSSEAIKRRAEDYERAKLANVQMPIRLAAIIAGMAATEANVAAAAAIVWAEQDFEQKDVRAKQREIDNAIDANDLVQAKQFKKERVALEQRLEEQEARAAGEAAKENKRTKASEATNMAGIGLYIYIGLYMASKTPTHPAITATHLFAHLLKRNSPSRRTKSSTRRTCPQA
jgi:hypothetical protein